MPIDEKTNVAQFALNFFESDAFESEEGSGSQDRNAMVSARNALRVLMMGWQEAVSELLTSRVINAVFLQRDRELLRHMRLAFQEGFNHLFTQLHHQQLTEEQFNQVNLFLSNCLTVLPYADITPYESFNIPQYIGGEWEMVDYKVVPIELTPTSGFKKLFINDEDRVFAYGLEPIRHDTAIPHLIFMGTTYPAGQGFLTQVNTDLEAFETAGKKLYRTGHQRLEAWLDKQDGKKPHVCGTSLGGSLSLLFAMHHGDRLARVDALNPAGIYEPWRKSRFDKWDDFDDESKPEVIIQRQGDDPVSRFGVWKKDWRLLHVIPPKHKQGPSGVVDHALNYAGLAGTQFIEMDVEKDNLERKAQNFWLYTLARSAVYYLFLVPYRYAVHPVLRYVLTHKIASAIAVAGLVAIFLASPIIWVAPVCAAALAIGAMIVEFCTHKRHDALLHDPKLPRNSTMDIYQQIVTTETFTVQQLHDYYHAKRQILKGKAVDQPSLNSHVTFHTLSKKDIMNVSADTDPQVLHSKVTIEATKAKIHDIKRTVGLMTRIGFNESVSKDKLDTLKSELAEQEADYTRGKDCSIKKSIF